MLAATHRAASPQHARPFAKGLAWRLGLVISPEKF